MLLSPRTCRRRIPASARCCFASRPPASAPWDALIRSGRSILPQPLPLTPGADVAGVIERVGGGVSQFQIGDAVFGATNALFTGAYAEYAVASAGKLARMPRRLSFVEAASVPVVACTAWQMVFDYGGIDATTRVLVHGAAGNVGAFATQLSRMATRHVIGTAHTIDVPYVQALAAGRVVDVSQSRFEDAVTELDVVLDTVGGDAQDRSFAVLKRGGVLVSSVSTPDQQKAAQHGVRALFFLVDVSSPLLEKIASLIDDGTLTTRVGDVLPLTHARVAHEMLAGKPHQPGKIVLTMDESQ